MQTTVNAFQLMIEVEAAKIDCQAVGINDGVTQTRELILSSDCYSW